MPTATIPPRDAVARLEAALEAILAELRAIRGALEQAPRRPSPGTLSRADRTHVARLLPVLAGVFGSDDFTAADLFTDEAPAAARVVVRGLNARRVGRLFSRAAGVAVDGFAVERHGVELHVTLWRVVRIVAGCENVSVPPPSTVGAL